jgi:hypothetical protein
LIYNKFASERSFHDHIIHDFYILNMQYTGKYEMVVLLLYDWDTQQDYYMGLLLHCTNVYSLIRIFILLELVLFMLYNRI